MIPEIVIAISLGCAIFCLYQIVFGREDENEETSLNVEDFRRWIETGNVVRLRNAYATMSYKDLEEVQKRLTSAEMNAIHRIIAY